MTEPVSSDSAQREDDLEQLLHRVETLTREAELSKKIARAATLDTLLDEIIAYIDARWGFDIIGIQLVDERRQVLRGYKCHGEGLSEAARAAVMGEVPLKAEASVSAWVALKQRPFYSSPDFIASKPMSDIDRRAVEASGVTEALMVPIVDEGQTLGVVHLSQRDRRDPLSKEAVREIADFVLSMAAPIQRISTREQLERSRREQEELARLCMRISTTIELDQLLAILGEEIEHAGLCDGYFISLADDAGAALVCKRIRLPGEFKGLESAYLDLRFPLDADEPNTRAYHARQPVFIDAADLDKEPGLQNRFERWQISSLVVVPIIQGERVLGTVFAFRQKGDVERHRVPALQQRLALFGEQIRNAQFFTDLKRREQDIAAAAADRQRFLDVVSHVIELSEAEQIYEGITREFLSWLPFDLAGVVMQEGNELVVKKNAIRDNSLAAFKRSWDAYYRKTSYALDPADGATAFAFVNNTRVLIQDTLKVMHLPMSPKDRGALDIARTPRTFFFVPIRRYFKPVGILWLISLRDTVTLSEQDIRLVEALCAIIGTSIGNAELYTTVERQRREIESALEELQHTQAELARAKEAAEASAAAKGAFVANTSHEIRTPLTAIIGFAEALAESAPAGSESAVSANIILRNGRHLLGLINDILDFSKIEAGRIEFEHVAYAPLELLGDTSATVGLLAQEKGLHFGVNFLTALPAGVMGDPVRVRQALLNLCNNAVKFTAEGGVDLDVAYESDGYLRVWVRDTGIGIREQDIERLFEPFTQADASITRRYGGTGLGLPITRQLIEGMGGSIQVRSTLGRGTVFEVRVPAPMAEGAEMLDRAGLALPALPAVAEAPTAVMGRVLVAEDGIDNQRLIGMYLERAGATATFVDNGRQALTLALGGDYDLVFLDIQMPVMSGIEAVQELRRAGYRKPVLALTANVMAEDVSRYYAAGFDGCVGKPVDRAAFFGALRRYLAARTESRTESMNVDITAVVARFNDELPERIALLERCLAASDWASLAAEAHKLKGSAGALGWPRLGALAGEIESLIRSAEASPMRLQALQNAVSQAAAMVTGSVSTRG